MSNYCSHCGAALRRSTPEPATISKPAPRKKTRKPSKRNQVYAKHFKKVQGKYKKKGGGWKKDGFKRAAAEARRLTKREMK